MANEVDDSDFAIHNLKEIVFILEDLKKHRTPITLDAPGGVSFLTSVLEVSLEDNYVYLDISPDERINNKIVKNTNVTLSTQGGVKVRWRSSDLLLESLPDGYAFLVPLPSVVERIQRRNYFRLNMPQGSKALSCKIPLASGFFDATIVDMSVGGIGILIKGNPPSIISQGAILEGCSVEFPGGMVIPLTLKVFGVWASHQAKGGEQRHHVGLAFEKLSGGASNVIQRYMVQLEVERMGLA